MIYFKITNGQRLVQVGRTWIGADTSDQKASFTVNSLFNGTLTAYFGIEGLADVYPVTLDASNECTIPAGVLVTSNMPGLPSEVDHIVNVSVQDSETTTSIARFPVFKTASGDNKPPVIPDSDAYDKLVAMIPNAGSVSGNSMIFTNGNKQLFIVDISSLVGGSGGGSDVVVGVSSVNGKTGAVTIDLVSLGGEKAGTAVEAVAYHNADTSAHADIRTLIRNLSTKVSNFLDIDDVTADQLSELLDLIKSNKDLIDYVTTNKVNVTDIVNDLNTDIATQPLSAAQGVALRRMIESVTSGPGTGENGGYYTPVFDESTGILSWTPSKPSMPSIPDMNLGAGGGTPSGSVNWRDIIGKPFYSTYEYDKDGEYPKVSLPSGMTLVKISDDTPAIEDFYGQTMDIVFVENDTLDDINMTLTEGVFENLAEQVYATAFLVVVLKEFEFEGVTIPTGVWTMESSDYGGEIVVLKHLTITIPGEKILDSAIPDTVVRKHELADLIQDVLPTWTGGDY